jgi:hypothetical protein
MSINEHSDYTKPFWVAKYEDNSVIKYGELLDGSILNTRMNIYTFSEKEDMIMFVIDNGGTYIDYENIEDYKQQ